MKTETQITVTIGAISANQNVYIEPEGFIIKMFYSASRADTKVFKLLAHQANIGQTLKIKNISGKELQFWLCNTHNKIIANAILPVVYQEQQQQIIIDFKMANTEFVRANSIIQVTKKQIQKEVIVEADQELLKKVEDPYQKIRKEEEQQKKQKEQEELERNTKVEKKAAITVTRFNKKDVPFV